MDAYTQQRAGPAHTPSTASRAARRRTCSGLAQLSLVEHALCPLDDRSSLVRPLVFDTGYYRTDEHKHARFVPVRITAHEGLSATDELYLWGLLALAFAQPEPSLELWATPHWCLKRLGFLASSKGGQNYAQFRQVLRRLAGAVYYCERFYDPVRQCERDRAFGFLKYDLPTRDDSSRAWRIVFDPLLWEYCRAKGGRMAFDLATYRQLDPAARRLFLLLTKIFWRRPTSPNFDVWHLGVHVLGFSSTLVMRDLKVKLARAAQRLVDLEVLALPAGTARVQELFTKKGTGSYAVRFQRGSYFSRGPSPQQLTGLPDSPLVEPLRTIGFDDAAIGRILRTYRRPLVQVWTDITLAAMEAQRPGFFKRSPQAYLVDNLKSAAAGTRTPPDWWRELKKRDEQAQFQTAAFAADSDAYRAAWSQARRAAFGRHVENRVGREEYQARVLELTELFAATLPQREALEEATAEARRHFEAGFEFPDYETWLAQQPGRSAA